MSLFTLKKIDRCARQLYMNNTKKFSNIIRDLQWKELLIMNSMHFTSCNWSKENKNSSMLLATIPDC